MVCGDDTLFLRPFEESDLKDFVRYRANPEVARFQSWDENYTLKDASALFQAMDYNRFAEPGLWFQVAIVRRVSAELLGDLALHFLPQQQVEIGFTLAPESQRKGVARHALRLLLPHLFSKYDIHRVSALTDTRNLPAQKLLEALYFRCEAHYIKSLYFKGSWVDEYSYALLREEYNQLTSSMQPIVPQP
ncbi:N-acetyltransferase [Pseudoalteromonas rubra]|uniref:N-acetyltransferase n=1 Tax=Pseudoalteromonas rubra TaxID=43658 RepID=A0A5S3WIC5_9GAMM|nr:GNAT family protein [Pseudoalteromonas rubra]TMP25644.1 N-acetyltransferase [Pseudoalteromonas rubra]TMP27827.1 N-acetyltransferase [Pseudoalteromonas rubra]